MKKLLLFLWLLAPSCNTGNLTVIADLPKTLKEVSGIETAKGSKLIWMLNDGGNKARLYGLNQKGKIIKELKIDAKNNDWEDISADDEGNIYIGDFGNNQNTRKNLAILKVKKADLDTTTEKIKEERIHFYYPEQTKFPPKKKQRHFDSEAFFWHNDSLYIFTKSRVKDDYGKTNLYKIPAKEGKHEAKFVNTFYTCDDLHCWITAADISSDGKKVILLNHKSVWLFTDFKGDDFFSGTAKEYSFKHESQKESICFKSDSTLYITDETAHTSGGNLYEFKIPKIN